jgi:flagellar hook-length control protein FliK
MGFAADAVLDVVTPPARPAPTRAPSPETDEPTFEDHLHAVAHENETAQEPEVLPGPQTADVAAPEDAGDPAVSLLGGEIQPVAPPAHVVQDQTLAPLLLQLLNLTPTPAQPALATKPQTVTPTAPTLPPNTGAPPPVTPAPTQDAATPEANDAAAPANFGKGVVENDKTVMPGPQTTAAPTQTAPSANAAPVAATPAQQSAEVLPGAIAALQAAAPAQEHATRQAKVAQQADAKTEAAPAADRSAAPPVTAPPRGNAKAVTPQNAAKDAVAFAPIDAPEAPPAQQQASATAAPTAASTHTQHAVAQDSVARAAPAAQQVAREIVRRFDGGNTRFELRLDPPELGRVEVKLEVSRDHRVTAVIAADSPQALTELARHARELEQMLQGAGLELGDNGLSFDLRQGNDGAETAEFGGNDRVSANPAATQTAAPPQARPIGYERWRGVRVDVMV